MAAWIVGLARGMSVLGASGLLGLALFEWIQRGAGASAPWSDAPAGTRLSPARIPTLARALALLTLTAGLLWLMAQFQAMGAPPAGPVARGLLTASSFGRQWLVRQALSGLTVLAVFLGGLDGKGPRAAGAVAALAGLLLLSHAFSGHAAADPYPAVPLAAGALHVLAAGVWFGGLLGLATSLASGHDPGTARRFSALAAGAVTALVGTGLYHSALRIADPKAFLGTPYGQILTLKLGFLLSALILAAINRRDVWAGRTGAQLGRRVHRESLLVAAVVVLGGVLASLPPGQRGELTAVRHEVVQTPDGPWQVQLWPSGPGRVMVRVQPAGPAGPTATPRSPGGTSVDLVARFRMQNMAMPPVTLRLRPDSFGGLSGSGSVLSMPGPWEMVIERVTARGAETWARVEFQADPQRQSRPQGLRGLGYTWRRVLPDEILDLYEDGAILWAAGRKGLLVRAGRGDWREVPGLPAPVYHVVRVGGRLLAATAKGLYEQTAEGWRRIELPGQTGAVFSLAASGDRAYALDGQALYRLTRSRSGWDVRRHPIPDHPEPEPVNRVFADPLDPDTIWLARGQSLEESSDGGRTLRRVAPGAPDAPLLDVQAVARDPRRPEALWMAAMVGGVAITGDGGRTWMARNDGLPETSLMALRPGTAPGVWYAGTMFRGVALTEDGGRTWRPIGLSNATVLDIALTPEGEVLAATAGMGVFAGVPEPPGTAPRPLGPAAAALWSGWWLALGWGGLRVLKGSGWSALRPLWIALTLASGAALPLAFAG